MAKNSTGNGKLGLLVVVLLAILILVGLKYVHGKLMWQSYAGKMLQQQSDVARNTSEEEAKMLAVTVATVPATDPLYKQETALQSYVAMMSKQLDRDMVIVDTKKKILADTVFANLNSEYKEDQYDEVAQTIADGKSRHFVEKSADYPHGIGETVVQLKDSVNKVIGALILSSERIHK